VRRVLVSIDSSKTPGGRPFRARDIVKRFLIPGSTTFLIIGLGLGVILLNAGGTANPWGRVWLTTLFGLYGLLSLPAIAHALIRNLQQQHGTIHSDPRAAKVLVVIGNGSVRYAAREFAVDQLTRRSVFCVFEAARLYRLIHPDWVVASGGIAGPDPHARPESELMREQLIACGVVAERIVLESASRTTEEQIANVAQLLEQRGLNGSIVVITTAAHISRVMHLCRARGINAVPSVTPELRYDEGRTGWRRWCPSFAALRGSESAIYEYLALAYAAVKSRSPSE
jgi:uncharacterized SAM-binding protein YcdF (DUF218 family)